MNKEEETVFAINSRNYDKLNDLIESGIDINQIKEYEFGFMRNWLTIAIEDTKDCDMIRYLIEKGADLKYVDMVNNNALMLSISARNIDVVKLMFNYIPDINYKNEIGQSALSISGCSYYKHPEIFEFLYQQGADVNILTSEGNNLIIQAIQFNWGNKIVERLIELGVDPYQKNYKGNNFLFFIRDGRGKLWEEFFFYVTHKNIKSAKR